MRLLDAVDIRAALPYNSLVDALDLAFRGGFYVPLRTAHTIPVEDGADSTLLMMPAWSDSGYLGVKTVVVAPENAARSIPAVHATYQLMDRETGKPLALLEGDELTARRTAAASALAARYLAAPDASRLLMIGTGFLSGYLPHAHAAVRPITEVRVWGRSADKAESAASKLREGGLNAEPTTDLRASVDWADVISSATLATAPLIDGDWLRPGHHVDLVGGFRPTMREADDTAIKRARLFCDTREGAMAEAGDLCDPIARGVIAESDVEADLFELSQDRVQVERKADEITLFKSCGTAIEDLAAAILATSNGNP